jgi:large subunit ribosomal protein L4
MSTFPIYDQAGKEVGTYELVETDLAKDGTINKQLLHDVVVMYEANKRQGTVQTRSRAQVAGSTKKLFKQKHTGRARAGNKRTGKRVGGGMTFAKLPKDWSFRLPKKAVQNATRMALLSKFIDGEAKIIDKFEVAEPKTRVVTDVFKKLELDPAKSLLAIDKHDPVVWKSSRNIEGLRVSPAIELNAYDILRQKRLLITKTALDSICARAKDNN